ncbi:MAG: hypothetical protein DSY77_02315 [Bacteroidetes bacterium]|nr:MAG: hypothetical protein DSY77_02315 [Bacteroidota bacterium]
MDYQSRKALVDKLQELELKYDVHLWQMEGVQVWPIIKKNIFFYHFQKSKQQENKQASKNLILKNKIKGVLKRIKAFYYVNFKNIPKADIVFSGAPSHRINYKGEFINRYFDPIMDQTEGSYVLAEYKKLPKRKIYGKERVTDLAIYLPAFTKSSSFNKSWNILRQNEGFANFLKDLENIQLIDISLLRSKVFSNLNNILNWRSLFQWFLKNTKAKAAFGLCYYNSQMYGMNLAARGLNIPCVDMQHGTQGLLHTSYNIQKHPDKGYNALPTHFWVWDELSKKDLEINHKNYKIIKGGNPSLSFSANKELDFSFDQKKPSVLITVQPLVEILPDYIYQSIKETASQFNWWIRLHPRMTQNEINNLKYKLKEFDVYDVVKIEEVTSIPLAQILANTDIHISKFSGTIAEAALMNVKTIIIDQLGVDSFQELISQNLAYSFTGYSKEEFILKLFELNNKTLESSNFEEVNYKEYINEIIK